MVSTKLLTDRLVLKRPPMARVPDCTADLNCEQIHWSTAESAGRESRPPILIYRFDPRLPAMQNSAMEKPAASSATASGPQPPLSATMAVLYFHGARETVLMNPMKYQQIANGLDCKLFVMEYPGYDASSRDRPSIRRIIEAANLVGRRLIRQHSRLFLFGSGFGCQVALAVRDSPPLINSQQLMGLLLKNPPVGSLLRLRSGWLGGWMRSWLWQRVVSATASKTDNRKNNNAGLEDSAAVPLLLWDTKSVREVEKRQMDRLARRLHALLLFGRHQMYSIFRFMYLSVKQAAAREHQRQQFLAERSMNSVSPNPLNITSPAPSVIAAPPSVCRTDSRRYSYRPAASSRRNSCDGGDKRSGGGSGFNLTSLLSPSSYPLSQISSQGTLGATPSLNDFAAEHLSAVPETSPSSSLPTQPQLESGAAQSDDVVNFDGQPAASISRISLELKEERRRLTPIIASRNRNGDGVGVSKEEVSEEEDEDSELENGESSRESGARSSVFSDAQSNLRSSSSSIASSFGGQLSSSIDSRTVYNSPQSSSTAGDDPALLTRSSTSPLLQPSQEGASDDSQQSRRTAEDQVSSIKGSSIKDDEAIDDKRQQDAGHFIMDKQERVSYECGPSSRLIRRVLDKVRRTLSGSDRKSGKRHGCFQKVESKKRK